MNRRPVTMLALLAGLLAVPAFTAPAAPAVTMATTRVSVATGGTQANGQSSGSAISANGRYVAFASEATNLVARDTNHAQDVFVRDRTTGATTRVSVATGGAQANGPSQEPTISANGRYVAFTSEATNLVAKDTNNQADVFVRDRVNGTTTLVSVSTAGARASRGAGEGVISANGRYVAFTSSSSNLVARDTGDWQDVFVRDRISRTTTRVSVATGGAQSNNFSYGPAGISANGRYVAFYSDASNLVAGDTNGAKDVFVRDRVAGATTRVSIGAGGTQANGSSAQPSISANGRYVAFGSIASNLVAGDTNGTVDVFVRDRVTCTTTRASVATNGAQTQADSTAPAISANGRYVTFVSDASNLVAGDTNGISDLFVRGRP
jgi:Tol biopolymer transport system component